MRNAFDRSPKPSLNSERTTATKAKAAKKEETLFGARNCRHSDTDLNTAPMLAVDSIQVLRDGAAAPYGSDAIAGVIATAAGLPKLKEEKSKSFTLGMA